MRLAKRGVPGCLVRWVAHVACGGLVGLAAFALSPSASAHGGIPRAFSIIFGPGSTQHVLVRSDIWGLMRSWDGGKTWEWSCAEVYSGKSLQAEYHPMFVTQSGRILVGASFDGLHFSDDFCNWKKSTGFGDSLVADVGPWGSDLVVLTSTSGDGGGFSTVLWKSTDQGDTWTQIGKPMPRHFIGAQVRVAPSDPKRVYTVGIAPNGKVGLVQRSDDGGSTWAEHEFTFNTDPDGGQLGAYFRLSMVHPTRPDVAFIRIDMPEGLGVDAPDSLLGTKDGGLTWTKLFDSKGDLPGLTISPDGKTLLIGGPVDGIQSADVDDALTQGPAAFKQVFSGLVWGLNWASDGTLYAGNNNFGAVGIPEITLGMSHDDGKTFDPVMNICQVTYPKSCGAGSTLDQRCNELWAPAGGFYPDFVNGPRCVAKDAGPDGGNGAAGAKGSCSCSAPGRGDHGPPAAFALAALAVAAGRIRRTLKRSARQR